MKVLEPFGRIALPKECAHPLPVFDRLVDDATTLLAARRIGIQVPHMLVPPAVVAGFLSAAEIISPALSGAGTVGGEPDVEPVRLFLEASRKDAIKLLRETWKKSDVFDELRQVPDLVIEGVWSDQPRRTREFLLTLINAIPKQKWWSLPAFIFDIKEKIPDFQRPAGDYDFWFIKHKANDEYLRGFSSWDEVDGALIRYFIVGPLYWLGLVELATSAKDDVISAFRIPTDKSRLTGSETGRLIVSSQGKIAASRLVARSIRYQIARFCEWEDEKGEDYRYRVTATSLKRAGEQGLKVNQLLSILAKNAVPGIPPAFRKALKRWDINGTEARIEV